MPCGKLPSFAKIDGSISKNHFYDTEKTLMPEYTTDTTLKTGKYWEKNLFYLNKYRPLFMLSNKDLYSLMPEKKVSVYQRINSPSVYSISLKEASIKRISLSPPPKKAVRGIQAISNQKPYQMPDQKPELRAESKIVKNPINKISSVEKKPENQSEFLFEQAKNQGVEIDKKIDTALFLKETKKPENYLLALDLLDDVIRIEPFNAAAYNIKAEIYLEKNDKENAMKNYIEVLKLNPYSKESCLGIAKILEPTNKPLAQKYYDRANQ